MTNESKSIFKPAIKRVAELLAAIQNCEKSGNKEWEVRHGERLDHILECYFPSGAGFDCGTQLSTDSKPEKIVFIVSFHHMDEQGYTGWTQHRVTVSPSFVFDWDVKISGPDKNNIKDYIAEVFSVACGASIDD